MKKYTAVVEVNGEQQDQIFNVPDLIDTESFIYNSVGISNSHTGRSDKLIKIKRTRKILKK